MGWCRNAGVNICLEVSHGLIRLIRRRWDKGSVGDPVPPAADPILGLSELSGSLVSPPGVPEQHRVNLAKQPVGQGQFRKPLQSMIHSGNVVYDFADTLAPSTPDSQRFVLQDICQRSLGPFDLGAQDGFFSHVHSYEQLGIRQHGDRGIEPSESLVCFRKCFQNLVFYLERRLWRQEAGMNAR